jgi:hypothetical protein
MQDSVLCAGVGTDSFAITMEASVRSFRIFQRQPAMCGLAFFIFHAGRGVGCESVRGPCQLNSHSARVSKGVAESS